MPVILTKVGKTLGQPQFGLDTFTEHYKCKMKDDSVSPPLFTPAYADVVLTDPGVPQNLSPHPDYPFMFLTDRQCQETGGKASALDLVYTGCLKDDGEGRPVLPPGQHKFGNPVQTATSTIMVAVSHVWSASAEPVATTLKFYAQTSELTFFSYGAIGALDTAPDPISAPIPIDLVVGSFSYGYNSSFFSLANVGIFFETAQTDIIQPEEVVAGKYWRNIEVKTLYFSSPLLSFQTFGGPRPTKGLVILAPGRNYIVGGELSISNGGGRASVSVTSVGAHGTITGFTISANTLDTPSPGAVLDADGGSGTGAKFFAINLV